jgi:hypothetical protein
LKIFAVEQCSNINFCDLLYKSPSETLQMLEGTYGKEELKKAQGYEWHKRFRDGRARVNDDLRCRRQ